MARQRRVPATRSIPTHELLEVECRAVMIVRDKAGTIMGKVVSEPKTVLNEEGFASLMETIRGEIKELNKMQK
jgi:hypothetical protein